MRKILVVLFLALTLVGLSVTPASAHAIIDCNFVSAGSYDPIVQPGVEPSAHQHDFLGNTTIDDAGQRANATYTALVNDGTNCDNPGDKAAYWVPTIYLNGNPATPLHAQSIKAYYSADGQAGPGAVEVMPADLRLVAGNAHATQAPPLSILYWGCGNGSGISKVSSPPTCGSAGKLSAHITFPYCWDGVLNDHTGTGNTADFTGDSTFTGVNHLRYPTSPGVCPSGFPRKIPQLIERIQWNYTGSGSAVVLSSGPYYTMHADFWNTWTPSAMQQMVNQCINTTSGHPHGSTTIC